MAYIREINDKSGQDLKTNHHQFEALFNFATIGIVVTNHKGIIVNFNKYAENQFGYLKDEVLGRPVEILLPHSLKQIHTAHRMDFTNTRNQDGWAKEGTCLHLKKMVPNSRSKSA